MGPEDRRTRHDLRRQMLGRELVVGERRLLLLLVACTQYTHIQYASMKMSRGRNSSTNDS